MLSGCTGGTISFGSSQPIVTKPIRTIGRKNDLEAWGFDAVYLSLTKTEENRSWLLVAGASQVK